MVMPTQAQGGKVVTGVLRASGPGIRSGTYPSIASSSISRSTWPWCCSIMATDVSRRSATSLIDVPCRRSSVAWVWRRP